LADRYISSIRLLGLLGFAMAAAAVAAGQISESWSIWPILLISVVAGATASGYTGIAYGAYAAFGGQYRTEATALGSSAMFAGVLILPTIFGLIVGDMNNYWQAYSLMAAIVFLSGFWLIVAKQSMD